MATKTSKAKANVDKPKSQKVDISQLIILNAYSKTFSSGKPGFFGKGQDPATGKRYQIIGAVELAK
jgi:hypothetical protein